MKERYAVHTCKGWCTGVGDKFKGIEENGGRNTGLYLAFLVNSSLYRKTTSAVLRDVKLDVLEIVIIKADVVRIGATSCQYDRSNKSILKKIKKVLNSSQPAADCRTMKSE